MSQRDLVYVGHMLDMARKGVGKTQGISRGEYDADENLRLAVIHLIQTIGEAARRVSPQFCEKPSRNPMGGHSRNAPQGRARLLRS